MLVDLELNWSMEMIVMPASVELLVRLLSGGNKLLTQLLGHHTSSIDIGSEMVNLQRRLSFKPFILCSL